MRVWVKILVGLQITTAKQQKNVESVQIWCPRSYPYTFWGPHWIVELIRIAYGNRATAESFPATNSQPPTLDHHQSPPPPRYGAADLGDFWAHLTTCCYQPCWLNSTDQKWSKHRTCSKSVWDTSKDEGIIRDLICAKSINIIQSPLSSLRSMDVSDCFSSRLENRSSKWKIMPRPQGFCSKVQCFVLMIYRLGVWTIMNHRLYI